MMGDSKKKKGSKEGPRKIDDGTIVKPDITLKRTSLQEIGEDSTSINGRYHKIGPAKPNLKKTEENKKPKDSE